MKTNIFKKNSLIACLASILLAVGSFLSSCSDMEIYPVSKRTVPEDYHPYVKEGKRWNYSAVDMRDGKLYTCSYRIQGDTLVGKTMYKKLFMQVSLQDNGNQWIYAGALREMAMQVFYLCRDSLNENLIFDFGVRKGNKLRWDGHKVKVYSVDQYIASKGFHYRTIDLNDNDNFMVIYQWIEGIGSCYENLFWKEDFFTIQYLATCYEDDVCIYDISEMDFL